jgi:di/tricarboxylate transporter
VNGDQIAISAIIVAAAVLFIWGRWRYDLVAFTALIAAVLAGVIPSGEAFAGFGHPAVITVLAVLVISRGLFNSGVVDIIARAVIRASASPFLHVAVLAGVAAFLSAFMNNVAALALLMPVAIQSCVKVNRSPALVLMPLAFGSILGGLTTLIGTPPNIIIASYRTRLEVVPFGMFDFTPVGGAVAVVGVLFVALIGWRLLPRAVRERNVPADLIAIEDYVTEATVTEGSKAIDKPIHEIESTGAGSDVRIIGLIRQGHRILSAARREHVQAGDVLMLEASPEGIAAIVADLGLELVGEKGQSIEPLTREGAVMVEAVVQPRSRIEGHTPSSLNLGRNYDVNILAVSRQGMPHRGRLRSFRFEAGDVLLLQGDAENVQDALSRLGCLPLTTREAMIGKHKMVLPALGLFVAAVAAAAMGWVAITIAFAVVMIAMVVLRMVSLRELYDAIDWPVLVLLGAMIPVGGALETTGTTGLVADAILALAGDLSPLVLLGLVLIVTMTLSDIMNNAATAIVMAPISIGIAEALGANPDPFLMAVAVGASCAFLTPIGHKNNTLILGPGGYAFGDYWRMGLPLEVGIVAVSVPAILIFWPL